MAIPPASNSRSIAECPDGAVLRRSKNQSSLRSCVAKSGSAVVTDDWAELVANKRAAARLKDLADIEALGESP